MRIKRNNVIVEVENVIIKRDRIQIGTQFYQTDDDTDIIADRLLRQGYADLSGYTLYEY